MTIKCPELLFYKLLMLIFIPALLVGCQSQKVYKIQTKLLIPSKEEGKIPLRAGLYLDPKLRNYSSGIIHMGEALSNGAQNIIFSAFKDVVIIYTMDPELIPKGLDALVIAEIDGGYFKETSEGTVNLEWTIIVKIKWTIQDTNGKTLYLNTFMGESKFRQVPRWSFFRKRCEAYTKAIEEQFTKAYIGITSANWWESIKKETK